MGGDGFDCVALHFRILKANCILNNSVCVHVQRSM